jgi:OPT oligopeptide transporter protein
LVATGMYLPVATTFAIFVGGVIRWMTDSAAGRRGFNEAQRTRVENAGILSASGMIAGEAMVGLFSATLIFFDKPLPELLKEPSYFVGLAALALIALVLVRVPINNAGRPEDPAPPSAMM